MPDINRHFSRFAQWAACAAGSPGIFLLAVALVGVWLVTGPLFHFSNTWQLIINTGTTIVTFLMVFLIQHTQNRDTQALQLKLDELIRAVHGARNHMMRAEEMDDRELAELKQEYAQIAAATHEKLDDVIEHVTGKIHDEPERQRG
ncbi:low affinity iron permease family protein [Chitiniphilus eburneus]|uniref:Low affinity iron permease family protein n=1 Tax=Chitiniphilus eburneus TaxID=2571148 RepID=A0A4U0PZT3_9NEIS|nr:low affinity iron permease family protein [Chitiniphilus eburneus]TJZ73800.1 low affinity iron permease family protein [Chitiniphilus eburneus]